MICTFFRNNAMLKRLSNIYVFSVFTLQLTFFFQVTLSGTMYFVGLLIGALIGGIPADYFGRKPVLFFFILAGGFGNLVGGLVSTFPLYVLFRSIAGIGEQGRSY